jgi:hypothetical protein
VTPAQEEPQAVPSGGILKEGLVTIVGDSSVCATALEDPPLGDVWKWEAMTLLSLTLCRPRLSYGLVS